MSETMTTKIMIRRSARSVGHTWEKGVTMWAIRNRRTKKWVYGTDYRYRPRHQRTSNEMALTYETQNEALHDMKMRECGKDYKAVPVRFEEMEGWC